MHIPFPVLITSLFVVFLWFCSEKKDNTINLFPGTGKQATSKAPVNSYEYNNSKGYWENGEIITAFDCPDSKFFPPIVIKNWDKIAVVNGRLPTYQETRNGTSIHHYGEKENRCVKPFAMHLPGLAYHRSTQQPIEIGLKSKTVSLNHLSELVVVIQIVQTPKDTIVGFRYLTGGCGGSLFRDFRFLSDEEVKKVTSQ